MQDIFMQVPVPMGIYIGKDFVIKFANQSMCEIWDRPYENVINKPLFSALPEVARQGFEEILSEVLSSGKPYEGNEMPVSMKRHGQIKLLYFNIIYRPFLDNQGEIIGIIQIATEVTDLVLARKKAERNEEVINFALKSGKIGTWYVDLVSGYTERSIDHDKILGFETPIADWNMESIFEYVIPEDLPIARKNFDEGLKEEEINCEVRILWPDQSKHWVNIKGKVAYNLKRQPISIAGIILDITEKKEIEEKEKQIAVEHAARAESERQKSLLEQLFKDAPALICTLEGPQHIFTLVNPAYQNQLFPGRELVGKPLLEALPEVKEQQFIDLLDKVYSTGQTFIGKEIPLQFDRYTNGDIEIGYFNFVYQAHNDLEGNIVGVLVFAFEVTEQITARKLVEKSEENLKLALEAGKMGTWHLDLVEDVAIHSIEHDLIFGYDKAVPEWGFSKFEEHIFPEDKEHVLREFQLAEEIGVLELETRILTLDNRLKWIAIKGQSFYDKGKAVGMAGIVMDITERKEREEEFLKLTQELANRNKDLKAANIEASGSLKNLSKANKQLKLINADLDNFIYTASHDLKAPISNIEGLMHMLNRHLSEDNKEKEVVKKILISIETSISRFKNTIEELTDIAKLQKQVDDITPLDLAEIVKEVLLDLETMIKEAGVDLEVNTKTCQKIMFSYKNLKSVVYNIVSNAIKYRSSERQPKVIMSCDDEAGDFISLTITDNGMGIKQEDINKIFSIYKRMHTHVEGTGIGLYLVKRIIDNAEGRIEVKSEVNVGSTFKVFLPVNKED